MSLRIITNNVPRPLIDGYELTSKERREFDYYNWPDIVQDPRVRGLNTRDGEEATFFRYRGGLYDLGEFMATDIEGWDGIQTDTFFSGTVVRFVPGDDDHVIVGLALA